MGAEYAIHMMGRDYTLPVKCFMSSMILKNALGHTERRDRRGKRVVRADYCSTCNNNSPFSFAPGFWTGFLS